MCFQKAQTRRACIGSTEEALRKCFEEAGYDLQQVLKKPEDVPWGPIVACSVDDDRRVVEINASRLTRRQRKYLACSARDEDEPMFIAEREDQMELLVWLLEEAKIQNVAVDSRSATFLEWAREMIARRGIFKTRLFAS